MSTRTRLEAAYRHGMRVRIGPNRERGMLLHCTAKDGRRFWSIRLQPCGPWVQPDASLIVEGPGECVNTCESCRLPFLMHAGSGELLCRACDVEQFGGATRDPPPRDHPRRRFRS